MLTLGRRLVGAAVALVLSSGMAGCMFGPSDYMYSIGFAKVGETYYVIAPLCDDERLEAIEVYDNLVRRKAPVESQHTAGSYWRAEVPKTPDVQRGAVALFDDKSFERVPIALGSQAGFPNVMGVSVWVRWPEGIKMVGDARTPGDDIPIYPQGADPATVKYIIHDGGGEDRHLSRDEIGTTIKRCARDNVGENGIYPAASVG